MKNSNEMFFNLTNIISSHLYVSQAIQVKSSSIQADFQKSNVSALSNSQRMQDTQIIIPSFCDLLSSTSDCSSQIITQKVNNLILVIFVVVSNIILKWYQIYFFGIKYNLSLVSKIIYRYQIKNLIPKKSIRYQVKLHPL